MGLLESLGVKGAEGSVDFTGMGTTIGFIILGFLALLIVGGVTVFYYSKKYKKTFFKNLIPIFIKVHGKLSRLGSDYAKEIFIPNSNVSIYFLKDKKIYLARPTRSMGKNEYWYYITENGDWINFDISMEQDIAKLTYDHTDNRYAHTNLAEIIKRNYKDKAVKWWKDPTIMNIISFAIMSIIFVVGIIIILARFGKLFEMLGPISENFKIAAENFMKGAQITQNINSGIIPR